MKKNLPLFAIVKCILFLSVTIPVCGQTGGLSFATNLTVGSGPTMVIPVDVNGTGHPGLVCANYGFRFGGAFGLGGGTGTTLSVFTNDGRGNLILSQTPTVGLEPVGVATADFNNDGAADIVCANVGDNTVTVLTNNHKGAFITSATYNVGKAPTFVAAADVNGDGSADLIVANYGGSSITVLTNNGHGVFAASQTITAGSEPNCVAAADFNGDGKIDIACANSGDGSLTIYTNGGHGSFTLSTTVPVNGGLGWVLGVDVDQNGSIDLVTAGGSQLSVFTNDSHGTFTLSSTPATPNSAGMVVAGDIGNDGRPDLIVPQNANGIQGGAAVLPNTGGGNFGSAITVQAGLPGSVNYPNFVAAADFNGDGNTDIAVSCFGSSTVTVLDQTGVPGEPVVKITSPQNGAVLSTANNLTVNTATSATNPIFGVFIFLDSSAVGFSTNAPFVVTVPALLLTAGTHALQAEVVTLANGTNAGVGWSPEIQINLTQGSTGTPPTVNITSPTNFASYTSSQNITVVAGSSSALAEMTLYVDGQQFGSSVISPYTFQIAGGTLSPGTHTLQATGVTSGGASGSSPVVNITVTAPGKSVINFDALNAFAGAVQGAPLTAYLGFYGATPTNITGGTTLEVLDTQTAGGPIQINPSSSPNIFTQTGLNTPVSFTLRFSTPLQSFGFTRAGLSSASGLVSHPQWTATIFDANGVELGSVSEGLIVSSNSVAARAFVLTGNAIASARFDSDSQGTAAFSAVLLDDLVLNQNPVQPTLAVGLSVLNPATNQLVSPATITLGATVNDQLSSSYSVSFYAGSSLLGTVFAAPYQLTVPNLLAGNYPLQARVTDSSGQSALSPIVPITVQAGANSTIVNFDSLNTLRAPVVGAAVASYLGGFGIGVANQTSGTSLAVESQKQIGGGSTVVAPSTPNVFTQTGAAGPEQFTLTFSTALSALQFTRAGLLASPFVSHPAWQATALDGSGSVISQVSEAEVDSSTNVDARVFRLAAGSGPGIAQVIFSSQGSALTSFPGVVLDNLILTTNPAAFPPAVSITSPGNGVILAAPPALTVTAAASSAKGIATVNFYANGALIGNAVTKPYTLQWQNPAVGNYSLTAVARDLTGVVSTSAPVNVVIQQSAYQFGIASQPVSQTVAAGSSARFAVVVTGTNYIAYQWSHGGSPIAGGTSSFLVLSPPIQDSAAGAYTVAATSAGATLTSQPAVLTVVDPPTITTQPAGQTLPAGSTVNLSVAVAGSGPFTFQWLLNGAAIPGATNSSYSIPAAQPLRSGNYQVVVANSLATIISAVAPVIVVSPVTIPETNDTFATRASINPLTGSVAASNRTAVAQAGAPLPDNLPGGNSVWFTWRATFTGTITLTTQGSDFDTAMAVYTGTALNNLKVVAADDDSGGYHTSLVSFNVTSNTVYQIAVDGYEGASGRIVLGLPAGTGYRVLNSRVGGLPVIAANPVSRVVAPGATAVLSVGVRSTTPFTCQWSFQRVPIPGATETSLSIRNFQRGSVGLYQVLVANAVGSVLTAPASLEIGQASGTATSSTETKFVDSGTPAKAAIDLTPAPNAVGGDTRGFSVSQIFSTVGSTRQPGEPEACGQAGGASQWFVYVAPGPGILQVNTDGSSFNTILGVYTGPGNSFATLVEQGCGYTTNFAVQGQPSVVIPNVTKGETFYVLVDGFQGASGIAQLQIGLGQQLTFRTIPPNQLLTAGSNATLQVTAIGSTPIFYQWQLNGANVAGATNSSLKISGAQPAVVGNYSVIASNAIGVITSSPPASLTLQFGPAITAGPTNVSVKAGQRATLSVSVIGINTKTNPLAYQWYFDGAPQPKATGSSLVFAAAALTNAGTYTVVISNSFGTITSAPATLTVTPKAAAQQLANGFSGNGPLSVGNGPGTGGIGLFPLPEARLPRKPAVVYSGLFYPGNGATKENAGYFTATVSGSKGGAFTGDILLDGKSLPFAGRLDDAGSASVAIEREGAATLAASFHLDSGAENLLSGVVSSGDWSSDLRAEKVVFDANAASVSGDLAFVLPSGSASPAGYLTITNFNGSALISGTLADGAKLLRASPVGNSGAIPIYAPLYSNQGLFIGWVGGGAAAGAGNVGQAIWIKPGTANAAGTLIVK
jgi:hypothetical protein